MENNKDAAVILSDSDCDDESQIDKSSGDEMDSQASLPLDTTEAGLTAATTVEPTDELGPVQKIRRKNTRRSATPPYRNDDRHCRNRQYINESQREVIKSPEASSSYSEMVQLCHHVVIQDKGGVMMDQLRATLLRKTIEKKQYKLFKENREKPKKERRLPVFCQWPQVTRGCLRLSPRDDFTLSWLSSTVECLPTLWEGSGGFRVIPESELPIYHTAIIYVADFGNDIDDMETWPYTLREFLAELNPNLKIGEWVMFKHLVTQKSEIYNHVLVMGVPPYELDELQRVDFRLFFATGSIYVKLKHKETGVVMGPKAVMAKLAKATATSAEKFPDSDTETAVVQSDSKDWAKEVINRPNEVDSEEEADVINISLLDFNILSPISPL